MSSKHTEDPVTIGWREWVGLPDLDIETIKAKVDTGARTSSLHAFNIQEFKRGKKDYVRFSVHPEQRNSKFTVECEALVVDKRRVMPSSGHAEVRPVIATTLELLGESWEVELTLTRRDVMGFRMLLGRQATRKRCVIDPGKSFIAGRRVKGTKRLKRKTRPKKKRSQ
ncbi:MAG: ATP-dependent zinc protease [Planctomycetota bacterium]|nr:ATP-dependent zinc protease [Planctomycetota bacterium]